MPATTALARRQLGPACLVGLIGAGIQASRTPAMHEQEGAEQGLRYIYKLVDLQALGLGAEALPELLLAAERMGFAASPSRIPASRPSSRSSTSGPRTRVPSAP